MEHMPASFLPDDILLEILHHVSPDVITLFRCATARKRWRRLIRDSSFLLRCWPRGMPHQSSLLGFFDLPKGHMKITTRRPLLFIPPLTGSVLGPQPRFLSTIIGDAQNGLLDTATPEVAHGNLLLLRLLRYYSNSVHLAVCDPLSGTCNVLPPIMCKVAHVSCTIFTGINFCSTKRHHEQHTSTVMGSKNFKVLIIVTNNFERDNRECNFYMFSSTERRWSAPIKCFDNPGFSLRSRYGIVCHAVAHWFVSYYPEDHNDEDDMQKYYTYNVNVETGDHTLTELSIPADRLNTRAFGDMDILSVDVSRSLSLFCLYKKADIRRLDIWTRQSGADSDVWLLVRELDLKPPRREWNPYNILMWSCDKSGTLFIKDNLRCVHRINVETGTMEEEQFPNGLAILTMPMEIDWAAFFASRLG